MGNSLENFLPKSSAVGVKILFRTQFLVAIRFTNFTHLISPEKLVVNFIVEVLVNLVSELITVLCPHLIGDEEPLKVNFFKNWSILTRSSGISAFQVEMKPNRKKNIRFILPTREVSLLIKSAGKRMWIYFTFTLVILSRDCLQEVTETSDFCC